MVGDGLPHRNEGSRQSVGTNPAVPEVPKAIEQKGHVAPLYHIGKIVSAIEGQ
jgi:hypothetical protein